MRFTAQVYVLIPRLVTFDVPDEQVGGLLYPSYYLSRLMDGIAGAGTAKYELVKVPVAEPDARLSTYTCVHCNEASLKELWGPGRVTCPHCACRAPAASEMP